MSEKRGSNMQLNLLKTILGSIALVLIVIGILAAIGYKKYLMMTALPPPNLEHPEIVGFATPETVSLRNTTTTVGTILSPRSIQLRTEVVGTVSEMSFAPGQVVAEGQTLLKLDTSVEEAQLEGAEATMKVAASTLKRTQDAAELRAISELELEQALAIMSQAKADVLRLKSIIRKKTLKAPFAARAGLFEIQVGQYLPEGTQITMLQGIDSFVHIDFMMPQQAADDLHVGDEIRLAVQPQPYHPKIIAVDSQADRVTRNVMARAKLDAPPASMQPNDSVRIELEYGSTVEALAIPATALRRSPMGAFVYVVEPDPDEPEKLRVRIQSVLPGRTIGQKVAVLSGLRENQTIVSDGSFKLRERLWVTEAVSQPSLKPDAIEPIKTDGIVPETKTP
jgi:membrane fusion protein, multidrug efflux system